jgi:thioredoxin reductase (NADPH)
VETRMTDKEITIPTHDVIVIGAGPAALTAAIYTTREDIGTILFERGVPGGLAAVTDMIDNYPGFSQGIEGLKLADELQKQAERFGAVIEFGEVSEIIDEGKYKRLETTGGPMRARAVLIATGSDYKKIGVPGEMEYYARGVHYCATCDGAFYRDKRLVVIVHFNTSTDEIVGEDNSVVKVVGTDKTTGNKVEFPTDGVFVFVGLSPNSQFLKDSEIKLDEIGFVITDEHLQTQIKGVFAAGDIRSGATMQIASAAGEGATAALKIREYLEGHPHPVQN